MVFIWHGATQANPNVSACQQICWLQERRHESASSYGPVATYIRPESASSDWSLGGDGDRCPLTCDDRVCDDTTQRVERTPIGCEEYASGEPAVRACRSA